MRADLILSNASVFGVQRFEVDLGEVFRVELHELQFKVRWFTDNDPVLALEVDPHGTWAKITATQSGYSVVEFQTGGRVVGRLNIVVREAKAATLGITGVITQQ